MIAHFEAFLHTAMDAVRERAPSKKEHQGASRALEVLNTETMLQLGMVADACDVVVRSWTTSASTSPSCRTRLTR